MKLSQNSFNNNQLIKLHDNEWLKNQRIAGKIAAKTLVMLEGFVKNKTFHSMLALNDVVEKTVIEAGGTCTFKNYKGFPGNLCISINQQLVHGIPDDTVLSEGDIVSFDLGVTYQSSISDTALTCIFGTPKSNKYVELINTTKESLTKAIQSISVGKKLGCIGNAIYKHARGKGFSVVETFGGHGISSSKEGVGIPHAVPFICNKSELNEGVRAAAGMSLAIEPLLTTGSTKTRVDKDGWTVWCDAEISCHEEHTIFIHEDHIEIITDRTGL